MNRQILINYYKLAEEASENTLRESSSDNSHSAYSILETGNLLRLISKFGIIFYFSFLKFATASARSSPDIPDLPGLFEFPIYSEYTVSSYTESSVDKFRSSSCIDVNF